MPKFNGVDFTDKEWKIIEEAELADSQYRNFSRVLNSSMPTKRYDQLSKEVLPGYVTRKKNAESKVTQLMKKKGFSRG